MSMGYYGASYADVVEESFVRRIVGKEVWSRLDAEIAIAAATDDLGEDFNFEEALAVDELPKNVQDAIHEIRSTFEKKTGLKLFIDYHDKENDGDRYDDVNGVFWWVDGVYELTPGGKKYAKHIKRAFYVTYG